jgi:hypothetical protein
MSKHPRRVVLQHHDYHSDYYSQVLDQATRDWIDQQAAALRKQRAVLQAALVKYRMVRFGDPLSRSVTAPHHDCSIRGRA